MSSHQQLIDQIKKHLIAKNITIDNVLKNNKTHTDREKKRRLAMKITKFLGIQTVEKLRFEFNPQAAYKKTYVVLDTRNAKFLDNNTKVQWALSNSIVEFDNSTNIKNEILNIKEVRIRSFYTSHIYLSDILRASLYIEEFGNEAIIGQDGNKFHFFFLTNNPIAPTATTISEVQFATTIVVPFQETFDIRTIQYEMLAGYRFNEGRYRFDKPTNLTSTITISMSNPFGRITWPIYTSIVQVIEDGTSKFNLIFPQFHGYPDGYKIISLFLPYFTTTDPIADADKIRYIRNLEVQRTTVTSPTTMSAEFNTTNTGSVTHVGYPMTIPLIGTPLQTQVFITGFRYYIELEISSYL